MLILFIFVCCLDQLFDGLQGSRIKSWRKLQYHLDDGILCRKDNVALGKILILPLYISFEPLCSVVLVLRINDRVAD